MKIARRRQPFLESAALSDLAFLLIIYFIVIAGFNVNRGFLLNLPEKDAVRMVPAGDLLRFTLDENGALYCNGKTMAYGEAERMIRSAVQTRPNMAVVLGVSPDTSWQSVVSFVDLAQKSEVDSFSFAGLNAGLSAAENGEER